MQTLWTPSQTGRFVDQKIPATTDALFVAAPFICTLWWLHLQMEAIQMMATSLSDPMMGTTLSVPNFQMKPDWKRRRQLKEIHRGRGMSTVWEPPVLNPYGSFLPLYGSSLHRGSFALNPYTGVFHPYTGVLRSMRCNSGTKFTPFALQTIPVDMYNKIPAQFPAVTLKLFQYQSQTKSTCARLSSWEQTLWPFPHHTHRMCDRPR